MNNILEKYKDNTLRCIHCNTLEEAIEINKLLLQVNIYNESLAENGFRAYNKNVCFYTNEQCYGSKEFALAEDAIIIEASEILNNKSDVIENFEFC